jgi:hypothetical protein
MKDKSKKMYSKKGKAPKKSMMKGEKMPMMMCGGKVKKKK